MNKNVIHRLPTVPTEPIVSPVFENYDEMVEWVIYQVTQLKLLLEAYLYHETRTKELGIFSNTTIRSIVNALNSMRNNGRHARHNELNELVLDLRQLCDGINAL